MEENCSKENQFNKLKLTLFIAYLSNVFSIDAKSLPTRRKLPGQRKIIENAVRDNILKYVVRILIIIKVPKTVAIQLSLTPISVGIW